jgi:hypothetical protein
MDRVVPLFISVCYSELFVSRKPVFNGGFVDRKTTSFSVKSNPSLNLSFPHNLEFSAARFTFVPQRSRNSSDAVIGDLTGDKLRFFDIIMDKPWLQLRTTLVGRKMGEIIGEGYVFSSPHFAKE